MTQQQTEFALETAWRALLRAEAMEERDALFGEMVRLSAQLDRVMEFGHTGRGRVTR